MTDPTPDPIGAIRARWSNYGGMGNSRSDEDYTDAGCRILARVAFRDFPVISAHVAALADEVRALRAENERTRATLYDYMRLGTVEAFADALAALSQSGQPTKGEPA